MVGQGWLETGGCTWASPALSGPQAGEGVSLEEASPPLPPPQVRLTLLQLKGLEDSYEGSVAFPTGKFTIKPLGFL